MPYVCNLPKEILQMIVANIHSDISVKYTKYGYSHKNLNKLTIIVSESRGISKFTFSDIPYKHYKGEIHNFINDDEYEIEVRDSMKRVNMIKSDDSITLENDNSVFGFSSLTLRSADKDRFLYLLKKEIEKIESFKL